MKRILSLCLLLMLGCGKSAVMPHKHIAGEYEVRDMSTDQAGWIKPDALAVIGGGETWIHPHAIVTEDKPNICDAIWIRRGESGFTLKVPEHLKFRRYKGDTTGWLPIVNIDDYGSEKSSD